jgi:hypothetical protein
VRLGASSVNAVKGRSGSAGHDAGLAGPWESYPAIIIDGRARFNEVVGLLGEAAKHRDGGNVSRAAERAEVGGSDRAPSVATVAR